MIVVHLCVPEANGVAVLGGEDHVFHAGVADNFHPFARVEIGWVERIELHEDGKAEVLMQIDRQIKLAKNAYAMIHQDGF